MSENDSGWWNEFFLSFRPVFDSVPPKVSEAESRYIINKLNLKPGMRFLDCPCGIGRIAIPLARRGIRVTGVDITPAYLEELEKKARRRKLKIDLLESDMRRIKFNGEFDAAGNLWSSLGYFEKEADDLLTLKRLYKALKPGGGVMLHMINRDWIIANFTPTSWMEINGIKVLDKRKLDYRRSVMHTTWSFLKDGQENTHAAELRLFSFHELARLMEKAGFVEIAGFGSVKDEPIGLSRRMMFVTGKKPK